MDNEYLTRIHAKGASNIDEEQKAIKIGLKTNRFVYRFGNNFFLPIYNWTWHCIDKISHKNNDNSDFNIKHPNYEKYYEKIVNLIGNTIILLSGGVDFVHRKRMRYNCFYTMIMAKDGIYDINDLVVIERW